MNKVNATPQILENNLELALRISSNQNSINDESEVLNQERSTNIECQTNSHANSNGTSIADFIQDKTNSQDDQEVIKIQKIYYRTTSTGFCFLKEILNFLICFYIRQIAF